MRLRIQQSKVDPESHYIDLWIGEEKICTEATLDEIESIESELTDLILQLYNYRLKEGIK